MLASDADDDCPPYLLFRSRVSWLLAPSGLPLHHHAPHVAQSFIQAFFFGTGRESAETGPRCRLEPAQTSSFE